MSNVLKVTKYQLRDFRNAVGIYYLVILLLQIIGSVSIIRSGATGHSQLNGATVVFIFILGLNCFKSNYKFMHANNVSRKRFYLGTIIAILCISLFMAAIDMILTILTNFLNQFAPLQTIFQQIYGYNNVFSDFLWSFVLLVFATCMGWLITMLYYRSNTILKIIISIMPVIFIIIFTYINSLLEGEAMGILGRFLRNSLGITNNPNPYNAVLSFTVGIIVFLAANYLLIRKAPIKD